MNHRNQIKLPQIWIILPQNLFQKDDCSAIILESQCNKDIKGDAKCIMLGCKQMGDQKVDPRNFGPGSPGKQYQFSEVTNCAAACVDDTEIYEVKLKIFLYENLL